MNMDDAEVHFFSAETFDTHVQVVTSSLVPHDVTHSLNFDLSKSMSQSTVTLTTPTTTPKENKRNFRHTLLVFLMKMCWSYSLFAGPCTSRAYFQSSLV